MSPREGYIGDDVDRRLRAGRAYLVLSAALLGSGGVWAKIAGGAFGVWSYTWVRSALILSIIVPVGLATRSFRPVRAKDLRWFGVMVAFGTVTPSSMYYAFNHLAVSTATTTFHALFLAATSSLGWLLLRERLAGINLLSLALALGGLTLVLKTSLSVDSHSGLGAAILSGFASGGELAASKKLSTAYSSLQLNVTTWGCILVTHLPIALALGDPRAPLGPDIAWIVMLVQALVGSPACTWRSRATSGSMRPQPA